MMGSTASPVASTQKLNCYVTEQTELTPFTTGRLNLPENITTNATYQVQYARRLTFSGAASQITTLRMPAGMFSTASLQALVSGLPANASFTLDIGNDGSDEWTGAVANASTNSSPDLAAAFNAYWVAQGAPVTGTLDVPVKVALSQPGQVLLTNLQITTAGSKQRAVRLPSGSYSNFTLDFTVGGTGGGPRTVALDVGADGSIDWNYSGTPALPITLKTGNLATAVNAYLAGKSGDVDVPLRFFVAPDAAVTLVDYSAAMVQSTDLVATGISAGGASRVANPTYGAGDIVPVQATLRNGGSQPSGPVTAAFFAHAEGWGDWYIGSAFVPDLAPGASQAVAIAWDTTGFQGNIPLRAVINPYGRIAETTMANNSISTTVQIEPPQPVVADFVASPTSGFMPLTVQFTSTASSNVTGWLWNFGDGSTSTTRDPSHRYNAVGIYTVTLTVQAPEGSDTAVRAGYVAVNTPPPPVANFSGSPTTGPAPLTVQFTDLSTGQITSRAWNFGNGATSTTANPSTTYSQSGTYTVTLTVTGPGGSHTKRLAGYVTVAPGQVSHNLTLIPGWNLVSLPISPTNPAIDVLLAPIAGKYTLAYAYNGCDTADPWKKFDPAAPSFANDLKQVTPQQGLWLRMTTTTTLSITGRAAGNVTMPLCSGWNLVGYPKTQSSQPQTALAGLTGCLNLAFVYRVEDAADPWKRYDPAAPSFANDLRDLLPGLGVWIKATQNCSWTVTNP